MQIKWNDTLSVGEKLTASTIFRKSKICNAYFWRLRFFDLDFFRFEDKCATKTVFYLCITRGFLLATNLNYPPKNCFLSPVSYPPKIDFLPQIFDF